MPHGVPRFARKYLEGIVAKRLADPYAPGRPTWGKILNRAYSQKDGRSELFERG